MKIKDDIELSTLEKYGYKYQENLLYPTYKKIIKKGKTTIKIEILVKNRQIFINKNKNIKLAQLKYLEDLKHYGAIKMEINDKLKDLNNIT